MPSDPELMRRLSGAVARAFPRTTWQMKRLLNRMHYWLFVSDGRWAHDFRELLAIQQIR